MESNYPDQCHRSSEQQFEEYVRFFHTQLLEYAEKIPSDVPLTPSGWTLAELLNHIVHMERRWLQWGFLGLEIPDPWGDWLGGEPGTKWDAPECNPESLRLEFQALERVLKNTLETHTLDSPASGKAKFSQQDSPPQLDWILLHIVDELARHLGQLEVAAEFYLAS